MAKTGTTLDITLDLQGREEVEQIKDYYIGRRVLLIHSFDANCPVSDFSKGTIVEVDDIGTLLCRFDSGIQFGILPDVDMFRELDQKELEEEYQR